MDFTTEEPIMSTKTDSRKWTGNQRKNRGSCLVESLAGGIVMILVFLGFIDLGSVIAAQYVADNVAYDACRMAASASRGQQGLQAQNAIVQVFQPSSLISDIHLENVNQSGNLVMVKLRTTVNVPAPFPFFSQVTMYEQVALPAVLANQ